MTSFLTDIQLQRSQARQVKAIIEFQQICKLIKLLYLSQGYENVADILLGLNVNFVLDCFRTTDQNEAPPGRPVHSSCNTMICGSLSKHLKSRFFLEFNYKLLLARSNKSLSC